MQQNPLRRRMHEPIPEQGDWLGHVLRGYLRTMQCRPTPRACVHFDTTSLISGGARCGDVAKGLHNVGSCCTTGGRLSARRAHNSSLAAGPFCRQTPKVEARCANRARRALCGGRSTMSAPTAIAKEDFILYF
jgi:hypothetical protein